MDSMGTEVEQNAPSRAPPQEDEIKSLELAYSDLQDQAQNLINERSQLESCLLYTSPSPRDLSTSRMPSSA